ncbi:exonuclease [Escherichia coli]|uniref:Exonuclease n=36 Tax=Escherichia coli TaxID=562 RepID=A0A9Q6Y3K2_ECOLX|nr:exonuclease [Escherichia coli]EER3936351.1 exonuclease [Escherichia coli O45:H2]EES2574997.1 exonuclease [Escherichia coli O103:H2]EEV0478803.1 exonuclease [Escherichia coli O103]EFA4277987.1 exonuclease [Escherichia coli O11]EFW3275989.1 exonuclease [Shigella flexneri]EFW7056270.1 exonuclease [Shigella sonnei]EHQ5590796.1 3'-5' exoribonuclease [Escherichia coli O157]EHW69927.1 exonuclease family protein [Escherichia coli DEC10B]EHX13183.1 exonuclease family protein [Escherichia coli DE
MSKVFICAAIPDEQAIKEEGAVAVATAIEAGDERRARAKFTWQFLEQYPAAQDCAYKFLVCEDKPGMPRPAIDSWDTEYMQENRWDEESASFIPVEPESDPINVNFDKLSLEVQNAVLVKFGTCENITVDMAIDAQELLQEDVATFDGHIVEALMKTPEINAMYPERKLFAIGWVKHKCKPGTKWPEIQAELRNWKKRQDAERKETGKYTSVVDLARAKANRQHTENPAEKIPPVTAAIHREYKQTWKTLDRELAYYLWPGDADAGNIDGSILRWAKNEVIARDREDWKRISASMRKQPDALRYSRQTIFGLVRERPIDIHKDPVALNKYITEYLTTKGVFEDEGRNQSATDTLSSPVPETDAVETAIQDNEKTECKVEVESSVEREGPFYFLFSDKDGEKYGRANKLSGLNKALAAGATEITKEEYFARKNGTYSGSQQNTGASDTIAQPEPVKVTADEVNKIMQAANISQPDADKLLAVSRGEFVAGISDPNDPKWVKEIETRDSVNQNQQETEQNDQKAEQNSPNALQNEPETKQSEPVVQQEPEKVCTACGQSGGGNCPDCGAVMGNATYQETFDEENQVEAQENDPEEMEGAEHPHKENTGGNQHHASDSETGEAADPLIKVNGHHNLTSTSRAGIHLMIDIETMGKNPNAAIISIGAIFFDPQTGDMGPEFSKTIDLDTAGGVIDRDVIKWWLKQSREAQSAILTDEIPLDDALLQLREFIAENSGEFFVQVWGNGANFDNVILRRSYERQGIPCPWHYHNDRDVRTIVELGKAIDFDARTAIPFEGERHNALDDARYQAKYVSAIWQKLIPSQADF